MAKFLYFRDRSFRDAADNPQSAAVPVRGKVFVLSWCRPGSGNPGTPSGGRRVFLGFPAESQHLATIIRNRGVVATSIFVHIWSGMKSRNVGSASTLRVCPKGIPCAERRSYTRSRPGNRSRVPGHQSARVARSEQHSRGREGGHFPEQELAADDLANQDQGTRVFERFTWRRRRPSQPLRRGNAGVCVGQTPTSRS
jgi:hypothetical protein